ncbi:MAG TPA: signal peptidase I [Gemmatimonadales bacterium]|nr:signal peptidase I [Gemmatimonadales bacterium]
MTTDRTVPSPSMSRVSRWAWSWLKSIAVALVVWFLLSTFLVQAFHVTSGSMEQSVLIGDFLFVNKLLYGAEVPLTGRHLPAVREPRRDEIVVIKSPIEDLVLLKRVVGLPGDTLAMVNGALIRNGKPVLEPYVTLAPTAPPLEPAVSEQMRAWQLQYFIGQHPEAYHPDTRTWGPITVAAGTVMTMGDNRDESFDCRYYGFIPRSNLRGRPLFIYFSYDPASWRPVPFLTAIRWRRLLTSPHAAKQKP